MTSDRKIINQLNPQRSSILAEFLSQQKKPTGVTPLAGIADLGSNLVDAFVEKKRLQGEQSQENARASELAQIGSLPTIIDESGQSVDRPATLADISARLSQSQDPKLQQLGFEQNIAQLQRQQGLQDAGAQAARKQQAERDLITFKGQQPTEALKTLQGLNQRPDLAQLQIDQKKAGATKVNVGAGQNSFQKEGGKRRAEQLFESESKARQAVDSLKSSQEGLALLDGGAITGFGADFRLNFGKALQLAGFNSSEDAIANTEAFIGQRGLEVGRLIQLFGAGTGLSDADREFATRAAAGNINADEKSLRKLFEINDRASQNVIKNFNTQLEGIPENLRSELFLNSIEIPTFDKNPQEQQAPQGEFGQEQETRLQELLRKQQQGTIQ